MSLYSGGLIFGRIHVFVSEIWGAYFQEGLFIYLSIIIVTFCFVLFVCFFLGGGGGLLLEFHCSCIVQV